MSTLSLDLSEEARVRRRYDRIAPIYDLMEAGMELTMRRHRAALWRSAPAEGRVLEVGVGTGRSLRHYPRAAEVTAIDISPKMLARAQARADRLGVRARLELADVQALPYADASFDCVVTTCVFCSVPDPVRGLSEIRRVLRPGGRLLMLEHVLSRKRVLRRIMQWLDPFVARLWGAHIARDTLANLRAAGFTQVLSEPLFLDVVLRIEA